MIPDDVIDGTTVVNRSNNNLSSSSKVARALHIKFSASNVTDCANASKLMHLFLSFFFSDTTHTMFSVHGGHGYIVCIASSESCACAKNQINFIAFSCLILSTVECYLWPCIPDDNTTNKPIYLYLSGAATTSEKKEGKSHKGYGLI